MVPLLVHGKWRVMAAVTLLAVTCFSSQALSGVARGVPSPLGVWLNEKETVAVEISPCGESATLCGRIVWLKKPYRKSGEPKQVNGQPFCGLQVISGFRPAGEGKWSRGTVFDPESDSYYKSTLVVESPDRLRVRGYILIPLLGKTLVWRRIGKAPGPCPTASASND